MLQTVASASRRPFTFKLTPAEVPGTATEPFTFTVKGSSLMAT